MYNYLLLITLLGGLAGEALAADEGTAGAGAGAGAGTTATESTLPEPKRPTFTIKTFPGADSVPNFNPVTGDCQWFEVGARAGEITRWSRNQLYGTSSPDANLNVWFEASPENQIEGTWCITADGHKRIMRMVNEQIESCHYHDYLYSGPLFSLFNSIEVDPANNNRLTVFTGYYDINLCQGAPSEWNESIPWHAKCPDWDNIPKELGYYKPDELALAHRIDRAVPQLQPDRSFNTGCMMLDACLTYYKHTPLLRSLLESLYWTYTVEFNEVDTRRWSAARRTWIEAVMQAANKK